MKKLKLGLKGAKDILSREELKKIMGGAGSGSGSGSKCNCNTKSDCPKEKEDCMADCEGGNGYYGHCAYSGVAS